MNDRSVLLLKATVTVLRILPFNMLSTFIHSCERSDCNNRKARFRKTSDSVTQPHTLGDRVGGAQRGPIQSLE